MAADVAGDAGVFGRTLKDARDITTADAPLLERAVQRERTKDRTADNAGRVQPRSQCADGIDGLVGMLRDADVDALRFLVRLGSPNRQDDALALEAKILDVNRDELATTQCTEEADKQERAIPHGAQVAGRVDRPQRSTQAVDADRDLLVRRSAFLARDAADDLADDLRFRRVLVFMQ